MIERIKALKYALPILFVLIFLHFTTWNHIKRDTSIALQLDMKGDFPGKEFTEEIILYHIPTEDYNLNYRKLSNLSYLFSEKDCKILFNAENDHKISAQTLTFQSFVFGNDIEIDFPASEIVSFPDDSKDKLSEYCYVILKINSSFQDSEFGKVKQVDEMLKLDLYFKDNFYLFDEFNEYDRDENINIFRVYKKRLSND